MISRTIQSTSLLIKALRVFAESFRCFGASTHKCSECEAQKVASSIFQCVAFLNAPRFRLVNVSRHRKQRNVLLSYQIIIDRICDFCHAIEISYASLHVSRRVELLRKRHDLISLGLPFYCRRKRSSRSIPYNHFSNTVRKINTR